MYKRQVGAGAVVGSLAASLLVGGHLAKWFGIGVALWGAPLVGIGAVPEEWAAILLLTVVGVGNALVDVGGFTLPARLVEDAVLARAFAAFEAILTLGVGAGAVATPAMIDSLGTRWALVAIGVLAPLGVLAAWRALGALDARMRVRDADIALLQGVPMLRPLPQATIERLAAGLDRMQFPAGAVVFDKGDHGDDFYVIEEGVVDVIGDGRRIRGLGPGDGFGEIALLRGCQRTRTVAAVTAMTLRTVSSTRFVAAVAGYSVSASAADDVIAAHLASFRPPKVP